MQLTQLANGFFVAPQIGLGDLTLLKKQGIASIICNRPDGEGEDQPSFARIKSAANEVGIAAAYLPMTNAEISDELFASFEQALEDLPKPIVAYCRTGNRSAVLWNAKHT